MAQVRQDPQSPLVVIHDVSAFQLVASHVSPEPIAHGDLVLHEPGSDGSTQGEMQPLLFLAVAEKAFPLYKNTTFGTHADVAEWYTFDVALGGTPAAAAHEEKGDKDERTWVRLHLPGTIREEGSESQRARDKFEDVLISHGLLLDGVQAVGDEWGKAASQSGAQAAKYISDQSSRILLGPPVEQSDAATFSRQSHRFARRANQTTSTVASYTATAGDAIASLASSAGSAIGSAYRNAAQSLQGDDTQTTSKASSSHTGAHQGAAAEDQRILGDTRDALGHAFAGVSQGATDVYTAGTTEAPRVIAHTQGEQSAEVATHAGQTAQNVGAIVKDATLGTSTIAHGYQAAKGATEQE
ncbi:unnamed protein product [Parajaminaea phylloscopi]